MAEFEGPKTIEQRFPEATVWYKEQLLALPEMTVERAPLADGKSWIAEGVDGNKVDRITSPRPFFSLEGIHVTKYKPDGSILFAWDQPQMKQNKDWVTIKTPTGDKEINGFVSIISDDRNRVFLTVRQEPSEAVNRPKFDFLGTPLQASATKLKEVLDGKAELDATQAKVLESMGVGTDLNELFKSGKVEVLELLLADGNRVDTLNGSWNLKVTDEATIHALEQTGGRFFTLEEAHAFVREGLLNGHTGNALNLHFGFGGAVA